MDEQPAAKPAVVVPDPTMADSGTLADAGVLPEVGEASPEPPVPPWLATE